MDGLWKPRPVTIEHGGIKVDLNLQCIATKENPYGWTDLDGEWDASQDKMRNKMRLQLMEDFNGDTDAAVKELLSGEVFAPEKRIFTAAIWVALLSSKPYQAAYNKHCRRLVELGTVEGAKAVGVLFEAGGPVLGPKLIEKAGEAVVRFHEMSPSVGEA